MTAKKKKLRCLCDGCKRIYLFKHIVPGRYFCFGISTLESRKARNIPEEDYFRFCNVEDGEADTLQLNKKDVETLITGFTRCLLYSSEV
jgi:hypothetical protein